VRVVGAIPYDPQGDGEEDDSGADLAHDGDPSTAWLTDRYATANLGGLKQGVGLVVRLARPVTVRTVRLDFGVAGTSARVYVGSSRGSLLGTPPVARLSGAGKRATVTASGDRSGRLVLVWLTRLPPAASGGGYRGTIAEVAVTGSR
jgi:hypothetical protein